MIADPIVLTVDQKAALSHINEWLAYGGQEYRLGGYAGTGKTTLLRIIIERRPRGEDNCEANGRTYCCAPTGKASSVLQSKLNNVVVTTIHSLLYSAIETPESEEMIALRKAIKTNPTDVASREKLKLLLKKEKQPVGFSDKCLTLRPFDLIIADETSMITAKMRSDLLATGAKVLFVGDPGQLPPIYGTDWFLREKPHYTLQEIQRQALGSPIVRLSMAIRDKNVRRSDFQFDDCKVIYTPEMTEMDWLSADQIITGKNITRQRLNRYIRNKRNLGSELPMQGEKMICLKNDHHAKERWVNGVQFTALSDMRYNDDTERYSIDADYEGDFREDVSACPYHCLAHYNNGLVEPSRDERRKLREMDYAYAITAHKSQGSEWDFVIISDDEMNKQDKDFRARWLYTAVTRAKNKLIWVQREK